MKELNYVNVVIDGEVHGLKSEERPEHIQTVAAYIDEKIKEIYRKRNNGYLNTKQRTLIISLNIADDLFKQREISAKLKKETKELTESLEEYLQETNTLKEQNSLLTEKIEMIEKELLTAKQELQEFKESFTKPKKK